MFLSASSPDTLKEPVKSNRPWLPSVRSTRLEPTELLMDCLIVILLATQNLRLFEAVDLFTKRPAKFVSFCSKHNQSRFLFLVRIYSLLVLAGFVILFLIQSWNFSSWSLSVVASTSLLVSISAGSKFAWPLVRFR